ncbi:MAG: hypothetical protein AB1671_22885, partial [Thermodesulfobacteriota bacterium]
LGKLNSLVNPHLAHPGKTLRTSIPFGQPGSAPDRRHNPEAWGAPRWRRSRAERRQLLGER